VTQNAANVSLFLGFAGLFWAFAEAGDTRFIFLVMCAIFCGYVYQVIMALFSSSAKFFLRWNFTNLK